MSTQYLFIMPAGTTNYCIVFFDFFLFVLLIFFCLLVQPRLNSTGLEEQGKGTSREVELSRYTLGGRNLPGEIGKAEESNRHCLQNFSACF